MKRTQRHMAEDGEAMNIRLQPVVQRNVKKETVVDWLYKLSGYHVLKCLAGSEWPSRSYYHPADKQIQEGTPMKPFLTLAISAGEPK